MKKMYFLALMLGMLLLASTALLELSSHQEKNARREALCPGCNVILISLDSFRADHLGASGYYRNITPNIDRLTRGGILFENAYSQAPVTLASHMSLMTSLYPFEHKMCTLDVENLSICRYVLENDTPTLAELFHGAGYGTFAYTGGGGVNGEYGFRKGFDRYHDSPDLVVLVREEGRFDTMLALAAGRPFFLFLHTYDTHSPYFPSDETRLRLCGPNNYSVVISSDKELIENLLQRVRADPSSDYAKSFFAALQGEMSRVENPPPELKPLLRLLERDYSQKVLLETVRFIIEFMQEDIMYKGEIIINRKDGGSIRFPQEFLNGIQAEMYGVLREDPAGASYLKCLYDARILETDAVIGSLEFLLEANGLQNRTIIVLLGDHGEEFLEHGGFRHMYLYEEILHVPLIMRIPAFQSSNQRILAPVELIDVFPTLADLVGLAAPGTLSGRSLVPLLFGEMTTPRPIFAGEPGRRYAVISTVDGSRYKLIYERNENMELYNLDRDPQEQDNIFYDEPRIAARLDRLFAERAVEEDDAQHGTAGPYPEHYAERYEELRSLGYI